MRRSHLHQAKIEGQPRRSQIAVGSLAIGLQRPRHRSWKDVPSFGRQWGKSRGRDAEVLCQHLWWRVPDPVCQQHRLVFVEASIVKHQQEFAAVRSQSLDRVRVPRWKIPDIALLNVIHEAAPIWIDAGDPRSACQHQGPLRRVVPVQLADPTRYQPHLHAGNLL